MQENKKHGSDLLWHCFCISCLNFANVIQKLKHAHTHTHTHTIMHTSYAACNSSTLLR